MVHIFGKLQNKLERSENIGADKKNTSLSTRYHQPNVESLESDKTVLSESFG